VVKCWIFGNIMGVTNLRFKFINGIFVIGGH
jgi:hypothetical protein